MEKKEAMEILKAFHDKSALPSVRTALETLFPELKESEDERIRKELIAVIDDLVLPNEQKERFNAWLEKQVEQKPVDIDYGNAFDEFISHIPEKDSDSCNSLYTYGDIEDAIKFGIKWYKQQKRHVSYDIIEQTFNKSKTYEFPENADAVTYSESILPTSVYKGENDDEYKMHKIIEAAYIEGQKQNQKNIEWTEDDEKKKLKNIEQNPVEWNDEDETLLQYAIDGLTEYINEYPDPEFSNLTSCEKAAVSWLKSLKERINHTNNI